MRDRKKRNIIIGSLCCLLVFMGIGYAILSQTLNISGTANMRGEWDIKITDISEASKSGKANTLSTSISSSGVSATFETELYMPGDAVTYNITVKNNGNIDAALKELVPSVENEVQQVKFSNNAVQGKVLKQKESYTFQVSVVFDLDATQIPTDSKTNPPKYTISLNFVQYTGNSLYTPTNETTDNSCFVMNTEGTITGYDYNCGTVVTVPAEIDGIQVKKIADNTFVDSTTTNYWIYSNETDEKTYYIFEDEASRSLFLEAEGITQEELDAMTSDNTYNYLKKDKALENINLGTLEMQGRYYKTSSGELAGDRGEIPITELDLSQATYLTNIDLYYAPNLKKLNLNTTDPIIFDTFSSDGLGTITTTKENVTVCQIEELIINTDVFNNTKKINYSSNTKVSVFRNTRINKLIILDGNETHKLTTSVKDDNNGLFHFNGAGVENVIIDDGITDIESGTLYGLDIETISLPATLKTIGEKALSGNELTNTGLGKLPSSLTSLATDAFSNNTNLTQITLTSPKDLPGWANGSTVDGKTVVYER